MQPILNQITTYLLAVLILISTTGLSITAGWCDCSEEEYVMLFASATCCSHEEEEMLPSCSLSDRKCCDTESQYVQSDIDFQVTTEAEWSFDIVKWSYGLLPPTISFAAQAKVGYQNSIQLPPIKAPPLPFGRILLTHLQTWIC
jgi:hypothetical protein